ncbi:energy transducer TonB [Polaribacter sp. 11A2H]|uniref:energy transducer TonB n=1 Tax=Polaribacter sp. 11A2H TaxID=2687290 RepID=UPI00140DADAB|nr:energy transducer TonB [Polaribacter sp. 11A2H]
MKNTKKLPTKQLEKFSNIFTQLGLVLVLFIVFITLEHKTEEKIVVDFNSAKRAVVYLAPDTEVLFTKEPKVVPKLKIIKAAPFIVDEIVKGKNTIIETVFEDTSKEDPILIDIENLVEVKLEEKFIEDVDFINIQNAPIFKGCDHLSKEENKVCFEKKMKQFVQRNFNVTLANEIGLHAGKHKIYTQFVIDDKGEIVDVKIRTAYKTLEKEALRVIKKLPKFKPGIQNSRAVKVRYNLPIAFSLE